MSDRPVTVAIVDDDASVRVSLIRLCRAFGLNGIAYASGREFLAALEGEGFHADCLLLDVQMPEMNGLELRRHLVARGARIPTIIFTAGDMPEVPGAPDDVGYVRKPVSAADLLEAIEHALGHGDRPGNEASESF